MTEYRAPLEDNRIAHAVAAGAYLVIALALLTVALAQASPLLPVALTFRIGGPGVFAAVDLAAAGAVVMVVAALARLAIVLPGGGGGRVTVVGARMVEVSQTSAITVFLVAQLNGVVEAGTLILVYAIAASAIGVLWMHSRAPQAAHRSPWPYSLGAAIAVVPWGIVALYQIAGLLTPAPAAPLVRVLTIVLLVLAAAAWAVERLVHRGGLDRGRAELAHLVLQAGNGIALVLLVVGLARPSALLP
jgi:hypothetical protein